jgi:hypothetical protein
MRRTVLSVIAGGLVVAGTAGAAATFNFDDIADGATFETTAGSRVGAEGSWQAIVGAGAFIVDGGVGVSASSATSTGTPSHPFLDASLRRKRAGLGVCSSATCVTGVPGAVTEDDNLGPIGGPGGSGREFLTLDFSQAVQLQSVAIRDDDHNRANGRFELNGTEIVVADGKVGAGVLAGFGFLDEFRLAPFPVGEGGTGIYVAKVTVAPIPLPAGALLVASGAGLLGWVARRRG